MSSKYIVTDHRIVLKLFASKNPWSVLLFIVPIQMLLFFLMREEGIRPIRILGAIPQALLYWSLIEYLIHRFYFHWVPRNEILRAISGSFHLYHHENPKDLEVINTGWVTGIIGSIFHFLVFKFVFQLSYINSLEMTFGLILVFYYYEWIHYLVHQRVFKNTFLKYLQNFHLTHHVSPKKNYGQITPIWDYLLGTVRDNLDTKDHPRMLAFVKGAQK
jgi:4-hydroxysphinganine ceramide fatty acyl 2-hydroxylase